MGIKADIKQSKFSTPSQKAIINVIYTATWINNKSSAILKPHKLSVQQYNILRILRGQKGNAISVNSLINRMIDKSSNASRLVEKLRERGFLERKVCEYDRRQVDVFITQQGLDFLTSTDKDFTALEESGIKLSAEECEQLSYLLDKMRS